ncbi:TPA: DUF4381 domain-containing protein [Serratia odorifera]|nr:DUF4381 domain-containing protein [Serratia odorifera]
MLEKGFSVPELLQPALPPSVSWFPLPPGWYLLGGMLLFCLLVWLLFRLARWRRNQWRRQAIAALPSQNSADGWLALIKRVLLIHQPRSAVSRSLTAEQLLQQVDIDSDLRISIGEKYCQPDNQLDAAANARLQSQLKDWLERLPYV